MNKKLIALAVAGVLAAPLVAQAQTANVTMYGALRTVFVSTKIAGGARSTGVDAYSSRWGVRGTEQINSGLNAIFEFEAGLASDQAGNIPYNVRTSWVGLSGAGFGTIKGGAGLTPWDDVMGMTHHSIVGGFNNQNAFYVGGINPIAYTAASVAGPGLVGGPFQNYQSATVATINGVAGTVNGAANTACGSYSFDARYSNSLSYETPNLGGVTVRTQYAFLNEGANVRADKANCSAWDTAIKGSFGPMAFGVAYAKHNNFYAPVTHDATNIIGRLTGSFGIFGFGVGAEQGKYTGDQHSTGSAKYNTLFAGVYVQPGGVTRIGFDFAKRNNGIFLNALPTLVGQTYSANSFNLISNTNGGGQHGTLYVNHSLSKRTTAYAWYSYLKPEAGSGCGTTTATCVAPPKATALAVALGHFF